MIRVLLDENHPRKLKWSLNADALTVPERGWGGIENGRLLRLASEEFDVLRTMDRGIEYQQNLSGIGLCIVVLSALSTTSMTSSRWCRGSTPLSRMRPRDFSFA
ncbi:hypothetical protein [Rubrivirga sp.]|uniref:hypothetical protein n=1 Tax=Rubrivirga sp. TaxID=1885344 RepID=UPI003C774485